MFPSHATSVHGGASTPSGWQLSPLGEVATFQRGFDLPTRQRHSGPIPVVSSAGITDHHDVSMVASPGVITGRYGTIGELFYVTTPFWPLNTTLFVRDFHGNDPRFVYYALHRFGFKTFSGKSGVPGVNRNELHREAVAIPIDVGEQRAIADALGDMDALLDALDRQIAKQRDLKQAAMQQLLTGRTRLPGFTGEWPVVRLGDHLTFLKHGTNSRAELTAKGSVKYLHYGDIHGAAGVMFDAGTTWMPYLPQAKARGLDRLQDGDLVFADASEDLDGVGRSVELRGVGTHEVVSGMHTIAVRFDPAALANGFKAYLQFLPAFRDHLRRLAAGTKVYATNRAFIANAEVALPRTAEQTAIAAVLSDMDAEITALEARRAKTRDLKQAMLQELLTGRTRLV